MLLANLTKFSNVKKQITTLQILTTKITIVKKNLKNITTSYKQKKKK